MRQILLMVVFSAALLSGCAGGEAEFRSARQPISDGFHIQRMLVLPDPPVIAAREPADLAVAAGAAGRIDIVKLSRRNLARWVGVDALPFLTATAEGRRFLTAAAPRALARGAPPEYCPAIAVTTSEADPSQTREQTVRRALQNCLAVLGPARQDCGCRIVALDDLIAVPRRDTAYATGTSARMRAATLGIDLLLVAEETPLGGMLLRDLRGPVAYLTRGADGAVVLYFSADGRRFDGRSIAVGFRRGRIAERIYAQDADGNRLSLLIGFAPAELADAAGAWLAWPPEG